MASHADEVHTKRDVKLPSETRIDGAQTMLQAFEWNTPGGGKHWSWLKNQLPQLSEMGITAIWIPPPTKAGNSDSVGYDIYDIYDLGEFEQKGSRATKYGTIEDLRDLIKTAEENRIVVIADAVLNHKASADFTETFKVREVDEEDRTKFISEAFDIDGWTGFDFKGRGDKYSDQKYSFEHFTATDFDDRTKRNGIFKIEGDNKHFAESVDKEKGNFDYLMFADLDHHHGDVKKDVINWGKWMINDLGFKGFRFDAVRHISENFIRDFVGEVRKSASGPLFFVGEFWKDDADSLVKYLERFGDQFSLFDTSGHYQFYEAGNQMGDFDLRKIFDNTLVQKRPIDAVTIVDNHDTQPGQTSESFVNPQFKPLAYALILLRHEGYPCVFGLDLWGNEGDKQQPMNDLAGFIRARKNFSYGETRDYWDSPICIGWVRMGDDHHDGCAVVLCTGSEEGKKRMEVGREHAGEIYVDCLGWHRGRIEIGEDGWAEFACQAQSVSIWAKEGARTQDA